MDVAFGEGSGKGDVFDGGAAAEGDVGLTGGEGTALQVDVNFVDGFALRFVDGGRPSEIQRVLRKEAGGFAFDGVGLFVVFVFFLVPVFFFDVGDESGFPDFDF